MLTPPSRAPFVEICSPEPEQNEAALFARKSYKTYVYIGMPSHERTQIKCLIDTSVDQNIVSRSHLHFTRTLHTKCRNILDFSRTKKDPINSEEVILLKLQKCDLRIQYWFGAIDNVAVDLLLGTSFMSRYI